LCNVCSFISSFILHTNIMCWKHVWHMNNCVNGWSTNLLINECHTNFASFYKSMCWMCFQCPILMQKMYKLWMNEFCMISIIKSWNVKFVMLGGVLSWTIIMHKPLLHCYLWTMPPLKVPPNLDVAPFYVHPPPPHNVILGGV
jgi:hypothetical protein